MRIKKSIAIFFLLTALLLFAAGCTLSQAPAVGGSSSRPGTGGEAEGAADKLSVVCTIFPQYDFVRQIAGDRVELTMLIRPGGDVHYYEPTPQDIIDIYDCDLFIYVGGESDSWADRILESAASDDLEVLSMMEYSGRIPEETEEGMWDSHVHEAAGGGDDDGGSGSGNSGGSSDSEDDGGSGSEDDGRRGSRDGGVSGEEQETEYDEHVWTSVDNSIAIVSEICSRLCRLDPEGKSYYRQRTEEYIFQLRELKKSFEDVVQNAQTKTIVFGDRFPFLYFAKEYGLDYKAAFKGCASNSEAGAETVAYLIDFVRERKIPVVFKLELSSGNIAQAIGEATGAEVRTFYSCHNLSKEDFENGETYVSMMRKNVESLEEALGGGA